MDLWQLNILCKVIELKSFSKAGKAVHLSQPTVSSHIKDLESHFGCRLIDRMGKETVPTKAGELLYGYARRLLSLRDAAESALAEFQGKMRGRLVIGGSTIPGGYILPRVVGEFIKEYPEVTVSLVVDDTQKIIERTLEGELEIGLVGARATHKSIVQETVLEDEMRLIVSMDHKWAGKKGIALEELFEEPFIIRETGSGTLKSIQLSLKEAGRGVEELKCVAQMGNTAAVVQGVRYGLGVSILSPIAVSEELKMGNLKALPIEGLDLKRSFYLTRHKYRSASPICKAFIEFLQGNGSEKEPEQGT